MTNTKITNTKYMIIDIECLKDYFSFQWKTEEMKEAKIFECLTDSDFYKLYHSLENNTRAMYCYSIDYDKTMINAVCKLVEKGEADINWRIRRINDYLIQGGINYFRINKEFWCDNFFKINETSDNAFEESIENMKQKYANDQWICGFLDEFHMVLGKSKVFKSQIIIDIPKMLYYYTVRKDGIIRPSISLKNIQLAEEGLNLKFDFNKYLTIEDVKKDGLYDIFIEYSLNDVEFLHRYFLNKCLPTIETRIYACEAIKRFDDIFMYSNDMIHSENNTSLLVNAFQLPEDQRNQDISIDYQKYIKTTGYSTFDNFVEFTNTYKLDHKRDKELKEAYCENYDKKYIYDDSNKVEGNEIEVVANSVDTFDLHGIPATIGLGGYHSAKHNYYGENLWHLDYTSLYPSIILQFKEYYSKLINTELYEALYNFRNTELKPQLKKMKREMIERSGNDDDDISMDEFRLNELNEKITLYSKLQNGVKLLLNNLYGILNSTFNLPIANKTLGRFICLYGQYRAIVLSDLIIKTSPESRIINGNTDGIIVENISKESIETIVSTDRDGYLTLGTTKIEKLIQYDVNNYIKIVDDTLKCKGNTFGTGLKQVFVKNEKLRVNMVNALNQINNEKVGILPIYFHNTKSKSSVLLEGEESSKDKVYYLTTKDKGKLAYKNLVKPLILNVDNEIMYFTTNKEDAKISEYIKFAKITEGKIMNFTANKITNNMKYIKNKLELDSEENTKIKRSMRLKINKILKTLGKSSVIMDKDMNILCDDKNKIVSEYANYTLTDIIKSNKSYALGIKNTEDIICVSTNDKFTINLFTKYTTLEISHISGYKCFIFTKDEFDKMKSCRSLKIFKEVKKSIVPLWTIDKKYQMEVK